MTDHNPTTLIPFDYQGTQVRTVLIDDQPWFVLTDLCIAVGIANARNVAARLDDDEKGVHRVDTPGGPQKLTVVTEAGMYSVILRSEKPEAAQFKRWVTHEVLPSIRRYGLYATDDVVDRMLADPESMIRVLTALKEERAARVAAEAAQAELAAQAKADAPKVLFADAVSISTSTILVGDLAKILRGNGIQIGATRLFGLLRQRGYLINRRGTDWNMPTQRSMDLGLFKVKETAITHSDGHVTISRTPKVTGKGQAYFVPRILDGRIPLDGQPEKTEEPAS